MTYFDNPTKLEFVPLGWDWDVRSAVLHAKGAGVEIPEPHVREWKFPNGLVVHARLSRDALLAQEVYWDAWVTVYGQLEPLEEAELGRRSLPLLLTSKDFLTQDEVEEMIEAAASAPTQREVFRAAQLQGTGARGR